VEAARTFVWSDLADWYLEHCKGRLALDWDAHDATVARTVLLHTFDAGLRLLHPVVPFVTEALWQRLPTTDHGALLARAAWPAVRDLRTPPSGSPVTGLVSGRQTSAAEYDLVREAISAVRQMRADYAVSPGTIVDAVIEPAPGARDLFVEEAGAIGRLTRSQARVVGASRGAHAPTGAGSDHGPGNPVAAAVLSDGSIVSVPLGGVIDVAKECARLRTESGRLDAQLTNLRQQLANARFLASAPESVVEQTRAKEREWAARADQLRVRVRALCRE
jgi:valyl-tRNA synthetase